MMPIRWEPGRRIVRADRLMDRLMRETWEPLRSWPAIWDGHIRPALDVYETQDQVVVKAALPGVTPKDLAVTITDGTLVIKGGASEEHEENGERYLLRERNHGTFHRAITLPRDLDGENATAGFEDGVLTVTLPKTETAKTRTVEVKVRETAKSQ